MCVPAEVRQCSCELLSVYVTLFVLEVGHDADARDQLALRVTGRLLLVS